MNEKKYHYFFTQNATDVGLEFVKRDMEYRWKFFNGCESVMDVGFGEGFFMKYAPKNKEVMGIDINKTAIKMAKKQGLDVMEGNAETFSFNNKVDGIHASHVIEHTQNPFKTLENWHSQLNDSGTLLLIFPDITRIGFNYWKDYMHISTLHPEGVKNMLKDIGFAIIKKEYGPRSMSGMGRILIGMLKTPRFHYILAKKIGQFIGWDLMYIAKKS